MDPSAGQITLLLRELNAGDQAAGDRLAPLVYQELRKVAARYMRAEARNHTLQPTALVNEAYIRMMDQHGTVWHNREHFFGIAAQLMRRVLVDHARGQNAGKRGGDCHQVTLQEQSVLIESRPVELLALDEALDRLEKMDARQARIVEMRYFAGLSTEETAHVMELSERTVKREWSSARAWLFGQLQRTASGDPPPQPPEE
jgi:RNA polymerase sigma-70 factor, ECF subfamily